jgi:hypothetical protein
MVAVTVTYWYCRLRADIAQGELARAQMRAQRRPAKGTEVDLYTADANLHYYGRPATGPLDGGVVISVGLTAAEAYSMGGAQMGLLKADDDRTTTVEDGLQVRKSS